MGYEPPDIASTIVSPASPLPFEMRAPASQILEADKNGLAYVEWVTKDRRAHDLELRMGYVGAPPGAVPAARYALEIGHGDYSWSQPHTPPESVQRMHVLPARGAVLRLSARRLRVYTMFVGVVEDPTLPTAKIAVSINPAIGSHPSQEALCDTTLTIGGVVKFPPESREWRVAGVFDGMPYESGGGAPTLELLGWGDAPIGTITADQAAEFVSIPIYAAGFRVQGDGGAVVQATFR